MNLSPHFTLAEMTATSVRDFDNTPDLVETENMGYLCNTLLEPVRTRFGPLHTTSGYRSLAVNRFIGGSITSAHMRGLAWDGVPINYVPWKEVFDFIIHSDLPYDQIIYEFGRWIHIGTRAGGVGVRKQALMVFSSGKYEMWNPKDPRVKK